jgi:hypothetical protein
MATFTVLSILAFVAIFIMCRDSRYYTAIKVICAILISLAILQILGYLPHGHIGI